MAAVVQAQFHTALNTGANAETGIKFGRDASQISTASIPKPNAAGTNYSWSKPLALVVTTIDAATSLSNLRVRRASAPPAGTTMWYRDDGAAYVAPAILAADNATTDDADPDGGTAVWNALPSAATVYDAGSYAASSTGRKGDLVSIGTGLSNLHVTGANPNLTIPSVEFLYDES